MKEGKAKIIGAGNYPFDPDKMTASMRLNRLLKQAELRPNVQVNSVHISLNFDPSESAMTEDKLMAIAETYMQKIGFGNQPFLAYRHHDAGHPHIHLVSTNITDERKRIDLHHLGIHKSEPARKEIEKLFKLVPAEGRQHKEGKKLEPVAAGRVTYGRTESKRAIGIVLESVLSNYKYASLPELNAVLRLYNILADRGSENSRIFKSSGLVYRILNPSGIPTGVPIKASDFYNKPTLKYLQQRFTSNELARLPFKGRIKSVIDLALLGNKLTLNEFIKAIEKQGIQVSLRQSEKGQLYGITFIDHQTKCVFNGSDLGKQYSAKAILERCAATDAPRQDLLRNPAKSQSGLQPQAKASAETVSPLSNKNEIELLDDLMRVENVSQYLPSELKGKRKKKGKRNQNNNQ